MIDIIEKNMVAKKDNIEFCEDGLYVDENFIAVIDGVTSKSKVLWNGKTSGLYAKELMMHALSGLSNDMDAPNAIRFINQKLYNAYDFTKNDYKKNIADRLAATIIIYSKVKQQIWAFGDCQCMVNGKLLSHNMKIDKLIAEVRCMFDHAELMKGKTVEELLERDTGRDFIQPLLLNQQLFSNQTCEYGYDVLDGFTIHLERIVVYDLKSGDQIVLASDGYPLLKSTLEESEKELAYLRKTDPLCINQFKSTKRWIPGNNGFDDRTYIRFTA